MEAASIIVNEVIKTISNWFFFYEKVLSVRKNSQAKIN